jgi:hypothetical protein
MKSWVKDAKKRKIDRLRLQKRLYSEGNPSAIASGRKIAPATRPDSEGMCFRSETAKADPLADNGTTGLRWTPVLMPDSASADWMGNGSAAPGRNVLPRRAAKWIAEVVR